MSRSYIERERQKRILARVPWIRKLSIGTRCDGIKWSKVPLKAVYAIAGRKPTGITDQYRCRNMAHWKFTALKTSKMHPATSGTYCWQHLMNLGIYYNSEETTRFQEWMAHEAER
jgi:hypothetical protein